MYEDHHEEEPWAGTIGYYIWGLILSLLLTLSAYVVADRQLLTNKALAFTLSALGLTQLVVQLLCFLHLGRDRRPYWNWMAFFFMLSVVVVVIGGSLWIMYNLSDRVMTLPHEGL